MKQHLYILMPGALLLSYAVYTAFIPVTIAHSLILFSLAGLFGYSLYLYSQKLPSVHTELKNLQNSTDLKLKQQEEFYAERLKRVEDLAGGLALASNRAGSVPLHKPANDKKIQF